MKAGMSDVVMDLTERGVKHAAVIDWDEESPAKAFKLTRQEMKAFLGTNRDIQTAELYKRLKGRVPMVECAKWLHDHIAHPGLHQHLNLPGVEAAGRQEVQKLCEFPLGLLCGGTTHSIRLSAKMGHWSKVIGTSTARSMPTRTTVSVPLLPLVGRPHDRRKVLLRRGHHHVFILHHHVLAAAGSPDLIGAGSAEDVRREQCVDSVPLRLVQRRRLAGELLGFLLARHASSPGAAVHRRAGQPEPVPAGGSPSVVPGGAVGQSL